jgi:pimeloyl-ACP methyl ester carboxylesterase
LRLRARTLLLAPLILAGAAHAQETRMVPVTVDGETVRLAMRVYAAPAPGPAPTLVFNHGSTGRGNNPDAFSRPIDFPELARFFVARGWAVVMPARRGRGGSEGVYDEGFAADRESGYACDPSRSIPGADRALRDLEAAMKVILAMPFVDRTRVVIGGQSRGGILSVAYAGRRPEQVKGVINFVGGWLGGGRCTTASHVNQALLVRGAPYPEETLWLYGADDVFYSLSHSWANFSAFQAAGGKGTFLEFPAPAPWMGHQIVAHPTLWGSRVEAYLKRRGLAGKIGE